MKVNKLSVIVPTFNEAKTIKTIVSRLKKVNLAKTRLEIIIVDDGSTDSTDKLLKTIKGSKVITHTKNKGKGAAIRTGLKHVTGSFVLIQDADLEYDPQDIPLLLRPILEDKAEVVYGSRFLGPHKNMLFWHMIGNKSLTFLTNILFNTTLSDMEVGYKIFPVKLIKSINLTRDRFGFEPEITTKILKRGIRIFEVPISYTGREFSEGKKITWKDALLAFWLLIRFRLFK